MTTNEYEWYDTTRRYTLELARTRSVTPSLGESRAAEDALRLLHEDGLAGAYTLSGLDPVVDDPYGRHNAYAFVQGQSRRTVVLFGHVDTVGTSDYGPLEPWALDPAALASRIDALGQLVPDLASDLAAHPGDWMLGRGVADMKSGVASHIMAVEFLKAAGLTPKGDVHINIVIDEDGTVWFVDWPWACTGPPAVDLVVLLVNFAVAGLDAALSIADAALPNAAAAIQ